LQNISNHYTFALLVFHKLFRHAAFVGLTLRKKYQGQVALHSLNLMLREGKVFCLLG